MPHVGKVFPLGTNREVWGFVFPYQGLPRKWALDWVTSSGAIDATWHAVNVLSDLGIVATDGQSIVYRFDHPTSATDWIELELTLVEALGVSPTTNYRLGMACRLYHSAALIASVSTSFIRGFNPWELVSGRLQLFGWNAPNWIPPTPGEQLIFGWRWATWGEQPEYTPYVTRP